MSEIRENKMGTKPMLPLVLTMSLPAMFSMMIQALYNVVDSIFVDTLLHSHAFNHLALLISDDAINERSLNNLF